MADRGYTTGMARPRSLHDDGLQGLREDAVLRRSSTARERQLRRGLERHTRRLNATTHTHYDRNDDWKEKHTHGDHDEDDDDANNEG